MLNPQHLDILANQRGLDAELLARLGVSSSSKGGDWIEIPYFHDGRHVNTKYRTIAGEKRFMQDKGGEKCFWNIDVLKDESLSRSPLIITEGEFDAMAAMTAGCDRVISVPDGAPPEEIGDDDSGKKYSYVFDAKPLMRDVHEIILATDGDPQGVALMHDLALRLGKARCRYVTYPFKRGSATERCKDLNEVLLEYGDKGVTKTIQRAAWIKVGGIYSLGELPPVVAPDVVKIGIHELDDAYKIRPGDFTVITGIPGHGKSSLANEIACRMASEPHYWNVVIASFEQRPVPDHRRLLRSFYGEKREIDMTYDPELLARADEWIERRFTFVLADEDEDVTLRWLLEKIEAAIIQRGAKLVIVDPWNEMDHDRPPDMTITEYTGFAIKQFRKLARKYQVHVIVVAHPYKLRSAKAGEPLPMPSLYDISDSAHWFNKCDIGIVVHRRTETETDICVQKVRYHDIIGKPGTVTASYNRDTSRFIVHNPVAGSKPAQMRMPYGNGDE